MKKNFFKKTVAVMTMSAMMVATLCQSAFAAEKTTYYFVDCGDYVVSTVSEGDSFGTYNSVTDQIFGADPTTGKSWGIVDEEYAKSADVKPTFNEYDAAYDGSLGVRTAWSWANEWGTAATDVDKTDSFRYTKNMTEAGVDRKMTYKFELPDGKYALAVGFNDTWNLSETPDITVNGELVADEFAVNGTKATFEGEVTVSGGYMTIELADEAACINVTHIVISDAAATDKEPTPEMGDIATVLPVVLLAGAAVVVVSAKRRVTE